MCDNESKKLIEQEDQENLQIDREKLRHNKEYDFSKDIEKQFGKVLDKNLSYFLSEKENVNLSINEINLLCGYNKYLKENV